MSRKFCLARLAGDKYLIFKIDPVEMVNNEPYQIVKIHVSGIDIKISVMLNIPKYDDNLNLCIYRSFIFQNVK